MSERIELVKQVLEDVVHEAARTAYEVEGKPVYEIAHIELNNILARYIEEERE